MNKRILITGMGVVSAIGNNVVENYDSLRKGESGICKVKYLDTEHIEFPVGEVKLSNEEMCLLLNIPYTDKESRTDLLGMLAVSEALQSAGLKDTEHLALVSGTTVGGMDRTEKFYPDNLSADILENHDCGSGTDRIADYFGNFDFATTISTACSSALNAIIVGAEMIESGLKDVVVVGGTESLSRFHLNGFKSLMILDHSICRPFDADRAGLNLGEGAGFIVIESEDSAKGRGANVLAELKGTGNACDAYHQTASSENGEGDFLAMSKAIAEADIQVTDIQYVNAHGTGTPNNDVCESTALMRVFENKMPKVSSTKMYTGHTTSASGSIEAIYSILSLQHQFVPANIGWSKADDSCVTPYVIGPFGRIDNVMCNSFGFGGNDSSIIISRYGE
ncbi:beta-ketoacyl-[acyl-carrier-protein] synthase family protein [Prevotella sp.]|uniref:beta-ketoacyl-[acyl-carrier-protein] synthase family protein n=1 Tax=Prevotella sp. TaxID=59823 RepID=UPI00264857C3|nr:beta-ketoacyl-[acyl-carrier-protein] synthase family protein [Prevotella sp.]MDN5553508.1 beta-ketoacyl-[acyl-carrier-protein] synthase family protein [Prevotella sp.]